MNVACIAYTNTKPFFHRWDSEAFPLQLGAPRELARLAREGHVMAGPLPVTECWSLETQFEPLDHWGIAVREASNSVFLLSKVPIAEMEHVKIGVTHESSASVALLQVILTLKYGRTVNLKRGFDDDDDALLVIGDQALQMWAKPPSRRWPVMTDLATEWWTWKNLPFVFARWVVKKDLEPSVRQRLSALLSSSLKSGMADLSAIAAEQAGHLIMPVDKVREYLDGFTYELGEAEYKSMQHFRELCQQLNPQLALSGR